MFHGTTRRAALLGASALALGAPQAVAQTKRKLRFSSAFTEQDLRAEAYKNLAAALKDDLDFEPFWGNTLFKQGTELVALQRGNLEMCNLAPADISKQIPAWSLMTSAYLFRDSDHLKKTFKADDGQESARHPGYYAGLFRLAACELEDGQADQDACRPEWREAPHAAGRVLAIPWRIHRSEPDPRRLCRGLHSLAVRRDRRAGQPARREPAHEVLRGDLAIRPDRPCRRL